MTTAALLNSLVAVSACSATAIAVQGEGSAAQDWTVLGLLAVVVVGIGARLVAATEKNTATLSDVKTQLELTNKNLEDRERANDRLREDIQRIPEAVAKELGRRESP